MRKLKQYFKIAKSIFIKHGREFTIAYEHSELEVKRTVYYNLFILVISIVASSLLLFSILKNTDQSQESPIFYVTVILVLMFVLYLLLKGHHWLPIIVYSGIVFHSQISYFSRVPPGHDAYIISIFSFINIIWLLISYYWWHWMIYFTNLVILFSLRIPMNKQAWKDGLLSVDEYLSVVNAYNLFMMVTLISIGIYFLLKRERVFTIKQRDDAKANEEMYQEILASYNLRLGLQKFDVGNEYEGYFDSGTHCLNRMAFQRFFLDKVDIHDKDIDITLVYMDLDGLKIINDTHGHSKGDEYLATFVNLVKAYKSDQNILFRIGGDEFVMVSMREEKLKVEETMAKIRRELIQSMKAMGLNGGVSYGVAHSWEQTFSSVEELLNNADEAMYAMKREVKAVKRQELEVQQI